MASRSAARLVLMAALSAAASGAPARAQDAAAATPPEYVALAKEVLMTSIGFRTVEGGDQMTPYAEYLRGVLVEGGFPIEDIDIVEVAGTTTLTATYHGTVSSLPILLSGHMDVVEAKPEDWERDPFTAIDENGFIYGRGATDMKFGIASMVTTLVRLKQEGFTPARDIVLVLSGDEETSMVSTMALADRFEGAGLVLNADGGGGLLDETGEPVAYYVQGAEKTYADFRIEFTNPGGHSSQPRPDNAIYQLAHALTRIEALEFPVQASEVTRGYFRETGEAVGGDLGAAMVAFADDPADADAIAAIQAAPEFANHLATTCVATMLSGGHAVNALPQRASAVVNCRIFPGVEPDAVKEMLADAIGDPELAIDYVLPVDSSDASPLRDDLMAALRTAIDRRYPGLPIVPEMSPGASDSLHFRARGIDSYGVSEIFMKASDSFSHGLNERTPVDNIAPGLDHWHVLLTELAG